MCISKKFPGQADAVGPGNPALRTTELLLLVSSSLSGGSAVTLGALQLLFLLTQASVSSSAPLWHPFP